MWDIPLQYTNNNSDIRASTDHDWLFLFVHCYLLKKHAYGKYGKDNETWNKDQNQ